MTEETEGLKEFKIAMLIDGENAQPSMISKILSETGKYGTITIRRIYGDWTTVQMNSWKLTLHLHAIQPIQQFRYTVGKNSTDSALIIDAMDILHSKIVSAFCIVSSDSDFTRLATRLREDGLFVIGIGEKKTPQAFVKGCDVFVFTENLHTEETVEIMEPKKTKKTNKVIKNKKSPSQGSLPSLIEVPEPLPLLVEAFEMGVRDDGWCHLGQMGINIRKLEPSFDSRTYGFKQLSLLIKAYPQRFEIKKTSNKGPSGVYIKMK